jgi:hypothetical protein
MIRKTTTALAPVLLLFVSTVLAQSPIERKYQALGGQNGFLRKPTSNESTCAHNKNGRYRHYEGGTIYWHPDTGAHEVHGAIRDKYRSLKEYWGLLGFPVTDEMTTPDRIGRYNHFQHGSIYWTTYTGAHEVHGAIRAKWANEGWERAWIGYPESDETDTSDGGRYNKFQRAYIVWTPESGAKVIGFGPLGDRTDPHMDFQKLDSNENPTLYDGSYGNLKEFYVNMKNWHGIDLREGVIRNRRTGQIVKNIRGWQFADFWSTDKLNGILLSERERFVVTVADLLLMQWHLRDLKKHSELRKDQINRYFKSPHCFKRNWSAKRNAWNYNDWCSEFASYVYKRSGNKVKLGKKQTFWCKIGRYESLDWCMSRVSYFRGYFRDRHRYFSIAHIRNPRVKPPELGDYLCFKEHSMLVLGFEKNAQNYLKSKIYIVEGNSGSGSPEGSGKKVHVGWISLDNQDLVGLGRTELQ